MRRTTREPAPAADGGTATAEVALSLPALMAVTAIALWGIAAAATRLTCLDALHTAARSAARGEPLPQVRSRALTRTPPGSTLTITRTDTSTRLTLTAPFHPLPRLPLPALTFHLAAESPTEPTAPSLPGLPQPAPAPAPALPHAPAPAP